MKRPITILNLSDLHIDAEKKDCQKALTALPNGLKAYIKKKENERLKWLPDYIAIPGDIINSLTKKPKNSYAETTQILDKLLSVFMLSKERVIAVPGNHDRENISKADTTSGGPLEYQKRRYKQLKDNFHLFCSLQNSESFYEFVKFHKNDFQLFEEFYKRYCDENSHISYPPLSKGNYLKYVSGLKIFPDHKVCFLCLNTEWLYTRSKIEEKQEFYLCRPIVRYLTRKLNESTFADYTVVTLMHRKPDDLSWETKNHTDGRTHDSLALVEHFSDIIISGHDHSIRTNKPNYIKNSVQHFQLGSPSCTTKENEKFPYSVSAIHVDPISLTVELLTGSYNEYGRKSNKKWEFKSEGVFPLRNKYISSEYRKGKDTLKRSDLVYLKARNTHPEEIKSAIQDYYSKKDCDLELLPILIDDLDINKLTTPSRSQHWVLYSLDTSETVLYQLKKKYEKLNNRKDIHKAKLLRQLIVSKVVIETPQNLWEKSDKV